MTPGVRPARQLRGVLGRINPSQRQQGHDAEMKETPPKRGYCLQVLHPHPAGERIAAALLEVDAPL